MGVPFPTIKTGTGETVVEHVFAGDPAAIKQGGIDVPYDPGNAPGLDLSLDSEDKILLLLGALVGGFILIKLLQVFLRVLRP